MNKQDQDLYGRMAAEAEAGELRPVPGTIRRGEAAAAEARDLVLAATGADTIEDAARVALGRPRLDEPRSEARTWKVRAPRDLDELATELAQREGVPLSVIVRRAVAEYATTHAKSA